MKFGKTTTAVTVSGRPVSMYWTLADINALVASNKLNGEVNSLYPQELQPRDRTTKKSVNKVSGLSKSIDFGRLSLSGRTEDGAPIIGADMVVESGNGRVMAIAKAYAEGNAEEYREQLRANAGQFGLNPSDIDTIKWPVLVRQRATYLDRAEFARDCNRDNGTTSQQERMYEGTVEALSHDWRKRAQVSKIFDLLAWDIECAVKVDSVKHAIRELPKPPVDFTSSSLSEAERLYDELDTDFDPALVKQLAEVSFTMKPSPISEKTWKKICKVADQYHAGHWGVTPSARGKINRLYSLDISQKRSELISNHGSEKGVVETIKFLSVADDSMLLKAYQYCEQSLIEEEFLSWQEKERLKKLQTDLIPKLERRIERNLKKVDEQAIKDEIAKGSRGEVTNPNVLGLTMNSCIDGAVKAQLHGAEKKLNEHINSLIKASEFNYQATSVAGVDNEFLFMMAQHTREMNSLLAGTMPNARVFGKKGKGRSYYLDGEGITFYGAAAIDKPVVWHEFGHLVESEYGHVLKKSIQELKRRYDLAPEGNKIALVQGCGRGEYGIYWWVGTSYESKFYYRTGEYRPKEKNWDPGLISATELVSSGFEYLASEPGRRTLLKDKTYFTLIMSLIGGLRKHAAS